MKAKLKHTIGAMAFFGALLMLSCEQINTREQNLTSDLLALGIMAMAMLMLALVAWLSNQMDDKKEDY